MIPALPLFHAVAGQPVVVLGEGEAAMAKRRLVERAGGLVETDLQAGIDCGARLAFIAHDDAALVESDAARARAMGLLVNAVDRPELCDFTVPSLLDRAPVLVAVGTGGASAGLAKALRLRLDALLPSSLGRLAQALHVARGALRARFPDAGERRRALDGALGQGGPLDPLVEGGADRVAGWLASASAAPPGAAELRLRSADPDELTLREARLLGAADWLACEPGVSAAILARARADAERVPIEAGEPAPARPGNGVILRAA